MKLCSESQFPRNKYIVLNRFLMLNKKVKARKSENLCHSDKEEVNRKDAQKRQDMPI